MPEKQDRRRTKQEDERNIKKLQQEKEKNLAILYGELDRKVRTMLEGRITRDDVIDYETGEVLIPKDTELGKKEMNRLMNVPAREIIVKDSHDIERLIMDYDRKIEEMVQNFEKKVEYIKTGDSLPPGVISLLRFI